MRMNWKTWLIVLVAMLFVGEGGGALLAGQDAPLAAQWVRWILRIAAAAWLIYGLFLWREIPWVRRLSALIVGSTASAIVGGFCWSIGWITAAWTIAGIWAMAVAFFAGLLLIRTILSPGVPVLGVARTLVDEAIRMKVALVFLVALLLAVPVLPLAMDPEELLRYRVQSFLSWSMTATGILLALMTIFLSAGSITSEFDQRQIFLTMTKPISRGQYLLGKWLGVVVLDAWLVAVCGGGIYMFTMLLAQQPGVGPGDAAALHQQVLVAREAVSPLPANPTALQDEYVEVLTALRRSDPAQYGDPAAPVEMAPPEVQRELQQQILRRWMSLGPRQTKTYVYTDLLPAKAAELPVQLRLEPQAAADTQDGFVHLKFRINGRDYPNEPGQPPIRLSVATAHVLEIPPAYVSPEGRLEIAVTNTVRADTGEQPTISFNVSDGFHVLYRVGSFEGNLLRSLGLLWIRLAFLAMLGLAAGSFLGFPTAALLSLLIYVAAAASGYLDESLEDYARGAGSGLSLIQQILAWPGHMISLLAAGEIWNAFREVIRVIGQTFMLLVPSFAEYNPTPRLAGGLVVGTGMLVSAVLWIGVIWTGVIGLIGYVIFRKRELARVTV